MYCTVRWLFLIPFYINSSIKGTHSPLNVKNEALNNSRITDDSPEARLLDKAIELDEKLQQVTSVKDTAGWFTIAEAEVHELVNLQTVTQNTHDKISIWRSPKQ